MKNSCCQKAFRPPNLRQDCPRSGFGRRHGSGEIGFPRYNLGPPQLEYIRAYFVITSRSVA